MTDLTKWPRLLVTGEPVTREQANEVLIRTNNRYLATNDRAWLRQVYEVYGIPYRDHGDRVDRQAEDLVHDRLGVMPLRYLMNERVTSSRLCGPHGWCDWDGTIGCANYNIGKWPEVNEVTADLVLVATTFPYLTMHVQLVTDEGDGEVAATWAVRRGKAALVEPAGLLRPVAELDVGDTLAWLYRPGRERGVSLDRLREAIRQVRTDREAAARGEDVRR